MESCAACAVDGKVSCANERTGADGDVRPTCTRRTAAGLCDRSPKRLTEGPPLRRARGLCLGKGLICTL